MFENLDLGTIITIVIGLVATFTGGFWLKAKGKLGKVIKVGTEGFEFMNTLQNALEDDKLTKAEIEKLKKEGKDVVLAWKNLIKKE